MQYDKERFVRTHPQYGYGPSNSNSSSNSDEMLEIDRMRTEEFAHMRDSVYLDHAGATMYSSTQLQRVFAELSTRMITNPHSATTAGASPIDCVRRQTLQFVGANANEYELVFTSGATAALKLVGECFPWQRNNSCFAYAVDSHTSVLGIRGYAAAHGASLHCVSLDALQQLADSEIDSDSDSDSESKSVADNNPPPSLFAFPAECNFSGTRHPLTLVPHVQRHGVTVTTQRHNWFVLLDAAKFASLHQLDVSQSAPDFVALSFYKLCGYPTGLGALLVHRRALSLLRKVYFGGGAVQSILATQHVVVPHGLSPTRNSDSSDSSDVGTSNQATAAHLADGTQSFLAILALRHGLEQLARIGMDRIDAHTTALTQLLATELLALKHANGRAACELYGRHWRDMTSTAHGAVVACNFRRADGAFVGHNEVQTLASIHNIVLRTGCMCNPGACQTYLDRSDNDVLAAIDAGHVCGGAIDLLDGRPTGAVRLSLGYMSTFEDVAAFLAFARTFFVSACVSAPVAISSSSPSTTAGSIADDTTARVRLCKIAVFPIKSCRAQSVAAWPVGSRGLLFDREWAIVDAATRKALTLKDVPQLCCVQPRVDLAQQTLTITFVSNDDGGANDSDADTDTFVLPLRHALDVQTKDAELHVGAAAVRDLRVCAGACKGRDERTDVSQWLSKRLQRACALVRVASSHLRDAQASKAAAKRLAVTASPTSADSNSSNTRTNKIGFANQAPFLLVSRASVAHLNAALQAADAALAVDEAAFRANFVVDGCDAFAEDTWLHLRIHSSSRSDSEDNDDDGVSFDVMGPCSRCSMINVNPLTGAFDRAPLQTLSRYRRERSSIFFGQFLTRCVVDSSSGDDSNGGDGSAMAASLRWLRVGDDIEVEAE